jgi:hypothetical protein
VFRRFDTKHFAGRLPAIRLTSWWLTMSVIGRRTDVDFRRFSHLLSEPSILRPKIVNHRQVGNQRRIA